MAKHIQTICRQKPTNCLSMFDHFAGLTLRRLTILPQLNSENMRHKLGKSGTFNSKTNNFVKTNSKQLLLKNQGKRSKKFRFIVLFWLIPTIVIFVRYQPISRQYSIHIETGKLIWIRNLLTGFYMNGALAQFPGNIKTLKIIKKRKINSNWRNETLTPKFHQNHCVESVQIWSFFWSVFSLD